MKSWGNQIIFPSFHLQLFVHRKWSPLSFVITSWKTIWRSCAFQKTHRSIASSDSKGSWSSRGMSEMFFAPVYHQNFIWNLKHLLGKGNYELGKLHFLDSRWNRFNFGGLLIPEKGKHQSFLVGIAGQVRGVEHSWKLMVELAKSAHVDFEKHRPKPPKSYLMQRFFQIFLAQGRSEGPMIE